MLFTLCVSPTAGERETVALLDALESQTLSGWQLLVAFDKRPRESDKADVSEKVRALLNQRAADDPRIIVTISDPPLGALANLNLCLSKADGRYVKIMHPSEVLLPSALQTMLDCFEGQDSLNAIAYEIENSLPLAPFCPALETKRRDLTADLLAMPCRHPAAGMVFKNPLLAPQFKKHIRYFCEEVFVSQILANGKMQVVRQQLSTVTQPHSVEFLLESELQFLSLIGEISLLPTAIKAEYLSPSFVKNSARLRQTIETELLDEYWLPLLELLDKNSSDEKEQARHDLEHLATTFAANAYQSLAEIKDLQGRLYEKTDGAQELRVRKEQAQSELQGLLNSRTWRVSAPLRKAKENALKMAASLKRLS